MTTPKVLQPLLIIPDCHRPYHDKKSWSVVMKVGRYLKPAHKIVLGDFVDGYSISSFDRSPLRVQLLDEEIESANRGLDDLDTLTGKGHFIMGNHEDRLERYLAQRSPALYRMVKMEELLRLEERGWSHTNYKDFLKIGHCYFTHDAGAAGANAHIRAQQAFQSNVVIGHTHRAHISYAGSARGKSHFGATMGWLGNADQVDYMHRITALRDWQQAFGVGYLEASTGNVHIQLVPIVDGTCVVEGKAFRA